MFISRKLPLDLIDTVHIEVTTKDIFATVEASLVTRMIRVKAQGEIYKGDLLFVPLDLIEHAFDINVIQLLPCFLNYTQRKNIVNTYCLIRGLASSSSMRRHTSRERCCAWVDSFHIFEGHVVVRSLFYFKTLLVIPELGRLLVLVLLIRRVILYSI